MDNYVKVILDDGIEISINLEGDKRFEENLEYLTEDAFDYYADLFDPEDSESLQNLSDEFYSKISSITLYFKSEWKKS